MQTQALIATLPASARLNALGWQDDSTYDYAPMRVVAVHRKTNITWGEAGERHGLISYGLRQKLAGHTLPTVGDWVDFEDRGEADAGIIHRVFPRRTALTRKIKTTHGVSLQTLSANVDKTLCLMPMTRPLDTTLMARYFTFVVGAGCEVVFVFTHRDQNPDAVDQYVQGCRQYGAQVYIVDARQQEVAVQLAPLLTPGSTLALIGASGVGKSTLTNSLCGKHLQRTGAMKSGHIAGRHTTVSRRLFFCPPAMIIDTPGLRNLNLSGLKADFSLIFNDLVDLAASCRFRDCRHDREPDCAIQSALADGRVAPERWQLFCQLKSEYDQAPDQKRTKQRHAKSQSK